jgi:uncharacterized protein (TIRG00374 family)
MPPKLKKALMTLLQIGITVGLLYWVFSNEERRTGVFNALKRAEWGWLVAALGVFVVVFIGTGLRWLILVRVQGVKLGTGRALALTFIGQFFSMFLPGATAGDVLKIFYVMKEAPADKKSAALLSVLMDRLVGLVALVLISAVTLGLRYEWLLGGGDTAKNIVWFFIVIMTAMFGGVTFSFSITMLGWVDKLPQWFPLRAKFVELAEAYNIYARAWPATLAAFGIGVAMHLITFGAIFLAAHSIQAPISIVETFSLMPIISALAAIPISPGGLGFREALYANLMSPLTAVSQADATTISLLNYTLYAIMGIVGGVLFMIYRSSGQAPAAAQALHQAEAAVESEEQKITS